MKYELLLQPRQGAWNAEAAEAALDARGAVLRPDGVRVWTLKNGTVECRRWVEAGAVVATELKVPLTERLELMRELVQEASDLARGLDARLVDPQLTRDVALADEGAIAEQFLRTAQFAGRYSGVSEAVAASFSAPESTTGFKPGTKVMLGLAGITLSLWILAQLLLGSPPPPKVVRDGPPPGMELRVDPGSLGPLPHWEGDAGP